MSRSAVLDPGRLLGALSFLLVLSLSTGLPRVAAAAEGEERPWSADLRFKRYFSSHSSYEFGNPYPLYQAPLSRLEFPMNTWWAGGEIRRRFPWFSVGLEVMGSTPMESDRDFKDSDWTMDDDPSIKDIYSEAQCRIEASYMARGDVDLKIADWIGPTPAGTTRIITSSGKGTAGPTRGPAARRGMPPSASRPD